MFKDSSIGIPQHLMEHAGELVVYGSEQEETPAGPVILFALVKKLVDLHGGTLDAESRTLFNAPDGKSEFKQIRVLELTNCSRYNGRHLHSTG